MLTLATIALICGVVGAILGGTRGRPVAGFFLSAMFGPIGMVIVLLLDRKIPGAGKSGDDLGTALLSAPPPGKSKSESGNYRIPGIN